MHGRGYKERQGIQWTEVLFGLGIEWTRSLMIRASQTLTATCWQTRYSKVVKPYVDLNTC